MSTHENILITTRQIQELLKDVKRIAVLGIKTEEKSEQAAYYVPQSLQSAGLEIVPVPVYFPDATEILGEKVYRSLAEVPGEIDLVDVFRRPEDIPAHVDDILAAKPKAVWMQLMIRNDDVALQLAEAGIKVVQDRCLKVEHRQMVIENRFK